MLSSAAVGEGTLVLAAATVALPDDVDVGETVASSDAEDGLIVRVVPTAGTRSVVCDVAADDVTDPTLDAMAELMLLCCAEASETREAAARMSFILHD
ncbi:hypothetical protein NliqN6_3413 [Naganishia liquefaciens]|uniref:Uncharacterized protein n=1 Tax=Naganishia liquefaciens TaxID=104408 RepID=A0A8H3YGU3_9TREE|nr:hypothetical protein NliqN6_3413 [Naganishia liquefaciens]